jgi:hypothetical protein
LLLSITGEPGLGKTTLVELPRRVGDGQTWNIARRRVPSAAAPSCVPGGLESLLQGEGGATAAHAMKLLAPTWYVQLAPLAADDPSLSRVLAEAKEASQERRKRELDVFLREVSRQRPLVMFLDDIHWADPSSVDLLAYLGNRCAGLRLLLVPPPAVRPPAKPTPFWRGQA